MDGHHSIAHVAPAGPVFILVHRIWNLVTRFLTHFRDKFMNARPQGADSNLKILLLGYEYQSSIFIKKNQQ